MSKFKVGDMVQRVGDPFGPVGKVTAIDRKIPMGIFVEWPRDAKRPWSGHYEDNLERVELADWERELLDQTNVVTYIKLDETDPFEAAVADMVRTNRKKRRDYTAEGASPWENFDRCEDQTQTAHGTAVEVLIEVKNARLRALRSREGEPRNESMEDSFLDRANYCVIALARYRFPEGIVKQFPSDMMC